MLVKLLILLTISSLNSWSDVSLPSRASNAWSVSVGTTSSPAVKSYSCDYDDDDTACIFNSWCSISFCVAISCSSSLVWSSMRVSHLAKASRIVFNSERKSCHKKNSRFIFLSHLNKVKYAIIVCNEISHSYFVVSQPLTPDHTLPWWLSPHW